MSGDLELNKILGAGLATALLIVGLPQIFAQVLEKTPPTKAGYHIQVVEDTSGGPAKVDTPPDWGTVLKTADVAQGQTVFAKCQACHNDAAGAGAKIGPDLWAVVGRPVASEAGFAYSDAMKDHAKQVAGGAWSYDALYTYLANPQAVVPGTKMTFAGDKDQTDRVNLIAYLRSQGSSGYAIPAPDPKRQAAAAPGAAPAAGAPAPATGAAATAGTQAPTKASPAPAGK